MQTAFTLFIGIATVLLVGLGSLVLGAVLDGQAVDPVTPPSAFLTPRDTP